MQIVLPTANAPAFPCTAVIRAWNDAKIIASSTPSAGRSPRHKHVAAVSQLTPSNVLLRPDLRRRIVREHGGHRRRLPQALIGRPADREDMAIARRGCSEPAARFGELRDRRPAAADRERLRAVEEACVADAADD